MCRTFLNFQIFLKTQYITVGYGSVKFRFGLVRIRKIQIWTGPDPQNLDLDWSGSAKFRFGLVRIRNTGIALYCIYVVYTQYYEGGVYLDS